MIPMVGEGSYDAQMDNAYGMQYIFKPSCQEFCTINQTQYG